MMRTDRQDTGAVASHPEAGWRDPKRYLWLFGAVVPALVFETWLAALATGSNLLWWCGPVIAFVVVPVLDHLVGADADHPPDRALDRLESDRFYRWVT